MNAVETPVEQAPYVMPRVRPGQSVLWYVYGEKTPKIPPEVAFVIKSGQTAIELRTASGHVRSSVLHIDNPRLKNPDIRELGAWDFIEEDKQLQLDLADLKSRVSALEAILNEPAKKK